MSLFSLFYTNASQIHLASNSQLLPKLAI